MDFRVIPLFFFFAISCVAQTVIPLMNEPVTALGGGKLLINVQLGTDTNFFTYTFDTGASEFLTFVGTNHATWGGAVDSNNIYTNTFNVSYGPTPDPNHTNPNVLAYLGNTASTTVTLLQANGSPFAITNALLGVITNAYGNAVKNWSNNINSVPIVAPRSGVYGDFGAGLFQTVLSGNTNTTGSLYSILNQIVLTNGATKQGFIVSSGGPGGNASLTIGLTTNLIASFPIQVKINSSTNNGQNGSFISFNGVTNNLFSQSQLLADINLSFGINNANYNNQNIVLDTGGLGGYFNKDPHGFFITNSGPKMLAPGVNVSYSASSEDSISSSLNWIRVAGIVNNQDYFKYTDHPKWINSGIDIYYQYDVMFDTADGILGFKPLAPTLDIGVGGATNISSDTHFYSFTYLGNTRNSSNNSLTVSGLGTVLTNGNGLFIGELGSDNTVLITNGGLVTGYCTVLGNGPNSSNNILHVSGASSILSHKRPVISPTASTGYFFWAYKI